MAGEITKITLADYNSDNKLLEQYTISSELAEYVSYPNDADSLDYIAVPASKYTLSSVQCPDD